MSIEIEIVDTIDIGILHPHYNVDAEILVVGSSVSTDWPYGCDIDGNILFDLDRNYILTNFDLLVPRERWHIEEISEPPRVTREGSIRFSDGAVKTKSFSIPVRVISNSNHSRVFVDFGVPDSQTTGVKISEECVALIFQSFLKGFILSL